MNMFLGQRVEAERDYLANKKRKVINGTRPQSREILWYCNKDPLKPTIFWCTG